MSRIISEEWTPLLEDDKTTGEPAISSPSDALVVKRIDFKIEEDGAEKIFIAMNRFAVPEVMVLEGLKPRIAIDIKNVHSWDGQPESQVNGKLIKQIRTHLYHDTKKLRIVLDLDADGDYSVNPIYYKSDYIYCIEVKPQ
ncbi:AMIN domain-containing protein [Thermodesulfobacteriota bacterium]